MTQVIEIDAVVVGAGFGGLHALHRLRAAGFTVQGVEAGSDVGGTWYWNRYPGARCDVESLAYSYSFTSEIDSEWRWTERYATQPEIQSYLRFISERLRLRDLIRFGTRVTAASYDEIAHRWLITLDDGDQISARFCLLATGPLTSPIVPDVPGLAEFKGTICHTARWPEVDPDFSGQRVGVIGTGSSGTQLIPKVAEQAEQLIVFVRTPNFTVPA